MVWKLAVQNLMVWKHKVEVLKQKFQNLLKLEFSGSLELLIEQGSNLDGKEYEEFFHEVSFHEQVFEEEEKELKFLVVNNHIVLNLLVLFYTILRYIETNCRKVL